MRDKMERIKGGNHVKPYRDAMLADQGGTCALCYRELSEDKAALDHAHHEPFKGKVRAVICRECNILLGKVENAAVRTGTKRDHLMDFARGLADYMDSDYSAMPYHFKHKTDEEKRARANMLARKAKAKRDALKKAKESKAQD